MVCLFGFFFKQKTAYEMRISEWSSDVCSSDLLQRSTAQLTNFAFSQPFKPRNRLFEVAKLAPKSLLLGLCNERINPLSDQCQFVELIKSLAKGFRVALGDFVLTLIRDHDVASKRIAIIPFRSEEHTSELQSLMRISYAVFCLKKKKIKIQN